MNCQRQKDDHIESNDRTFVNEPYESLNVELSNNSTFNIGPHLILAPTDSFGVLESNKNSTIISREETKK